MEYPFKNLVFEGSGVLGIAYQGAYEVLSEKGIMPQVERVCGSSAGTLTTLLIGLDYSTYESYEALMELKFSNLKDGGWIGLLRLFTDFGWYRGETYTNFFKKIIGEKTGDPFITFRELAQRDFRRPYFVASNLSRQRSQIFSLETTPDMSLVEAARMAISIPYFFAAPRYQGNIIIEGNWLHDHALHLFDQHQTAPRVPELSESQDYDPKQTLGFYCAPEEKLQRIYDFVSFTEGLQTIQGKQQADALREQEERAGRMVLVKNLNTNPLDFNLSQTQKVALMNRGKEATLRFMDKHFPEEE